MLQDCLLSEIKNNYRLKSSFFNAKFEKFNLNCNIYRGNFYLDTFNYFLINNEFNTFKNLFTRDKYIDTSLFFTDQFFQDFRNKSKNFKNFDNLFVLGSSPADNYYSNLLQFLPRLFFIKNKKIKIAISRNLSNKLRDFINLILKSNNIESTFVYLDDGFYKFTNSEFPQFFNLNNSVKILRKFLLSPNTKNENKKIYITRQDASYRKIVNESDIVPVLISKGYKVINPLLYKVEEQIKIFSNADKIIAPHGSNLSNIIFCKEGTKIYEIGPNFDKNNEKIFEDRYKNLAKINKLIYTRLVTDTVPVENHSVFAKKYISNNFLKNSNYYKHLIVKINDIRNIDL